MSAKPTDCCQEDVLCVANCLAGTCDEPLDQQIHATISVLDYVQVKAQEAPCKPCSKDEAMKEFDKFHKAHTKGTAHAMSWNFGALLQLLVNLLLQLLGQVPGAANSFEAEAKHPKAEQHTSKR